MDAPPIFRAFRVAPSVSRSFGRNRAVRVKTNRPCVAGVISGFPNVCLTVTALAASRCRVLVDVGNRRADGNRHEDEEPREAAYRPRPRHLRDGG